MNKTKLIIRIVSGLLVLIMVLGLIIPYASATEIDDDATVDTEGSVVDNIPEDNTPEQRLPEGLMYTETEDGWIIEKYIDAPALKILHLDSFDPEAITIFACNIETKQVVDLVFEKEFDYMNMMYLEDGYYVLYSNDIIWEDSVGNKFEFNEGNYFYFYVGDNYDGEKYNIDFYTEDAIMELSMAGSDATENLVAFGTVFEMSEEMLQVPQAAIPTPIEKIDPDTDPTEETQPEDEIVPTEPDDIEDPSIGKSLWRILKDAVVDIFSGSFLLIIAIVVVFIALTVIKFKKQQQEDDRTDSDRYDDHHIE